MGIILASGSPRRKELMGFITKDFKIVVSNAEEVCDENLPPYKMVEQLSFIKAQAVFAKHGDDIVIGADTVVYIKGEILGKPKNEEDAFKMLSSLSGNVHTVATGVTILKKDYSDTFSVLSDVEFFPMTQSEIKSYIATGEPMDKAGSYGIQEKGALFIKGIKGDFYSVMGLPVSELKRHLEICGFTCLIDRNVI